MDMTAAAVWLNTAFSGFDYLGLSALHALAQSLGWLLTPLFSLVTLVGEKGACFFLFAIVLMVFKRTRKTGICIFVAVGLGALVTSIGLKDLIARPRPFEWSEQYLEWWNFVDSPFEDGFSFPSGHMTAAAAAMTAWMLERKSAKATACGLGVLALMATARCYLMAHHPSDILAACLVGAVAGIAAYLLVNWAWHTWVAPRRNAYAAHARHRAHFGKRR